MAPKFDKNHESLTHTQPTTLGNKIFNNLTNSFIFCNLVEVPEIESGSCPVINTSFIYSIG
jgi:hypothetical protein